MRYLGIDWGLKKVGLSFSEGNLASPLQVIQIKSLNDGVEQILKIVQKERVNYVVLGQPEGEMGKKVEKAIKLLRKNGITVETADETLSTQDAKQIALKTGIGKKARKEDDAISAAIILQRYLDEK